MKPERILITGGAGFIGSRLAARLAAEGHRIWILDNLLAQVHGEHGRFPSIDGDVVCCLGDVADAEIVRQIVADAAPQRVFHLAADTGTGQSFTELTRYCRTNVMGTATLLDALRELDPGLRRIVIASSRAVYGEGAYRTPSGRIVSPPPRREGDVRQGRFLPVFPEEPEICPVPTPEWASCEPSSVYGTTKLTQEQLAREIAMGTSWQVSILRFQNVYGPGQALRNPYTGVLSLFSRRLLADGDIDVFEDGAITRDFVYVTDVVESLVLAGWVEPIDDQPINIGFGAGTTILDAARQLARLAGRAPEKIRITGDYRVGDIRHAVADISRARGVLGWQPKVDFATGARALIDWAHKHREDE
ncbi:MAG: NAD-dependent epimerase/dehydratase family protein [Thiohalocapsa sp.]